MRLIVLRRDHNQASASSVLWMSHTGQDEGPFGLISASIFILLSQPKNDNWKSGFGGLWWQWECFCQAHTHIHTHSQSHKNSHHFNVSCWINIIFISSSQTTRVQISHLTQEREGACDNSFRIPPLHNFPPHLYLEVLHGENLKVEHIEALRQSWPVYARRSW